MFYLHLQSQLQQIPFSLGEAAANCCCNVNNVENPSSQDFHTSSLSTDPESRSDPLFCSRVLQTVKAHNHWGPECCLSTKQLVHILLGLNHIMFNFLLKSFLFWPFKRRPTMLLRLFFLSFSVL